MYNTPERHKDTVKVVSIYVRPSASPPPPVITQAPCAQDQQVVQAAVDTGRGKGGSGSSNTGAATLEQQRWSATRNKKKKRGTENGCYIVTTRPLIRYTVIIYTVFLVCFL